MTAPRCSTVILCASRNTTSMSCSTSSTVRRRRPAGRPASRPPARFPPPTGPASVRPAAAARGCCASAIATSSSRWSPCDSRPAGRCATCGEAKPFQRRVAACGRAFANTRAAAVGLPASRMRAPVPRAARSRARSSRETAPSAGTFATCRAGRWCAAAARSASSPSKRTAPAVGFTTPVIRLNRRGLAGAVRSDHRAHLAGLDAHRHVDRPRRCRR